MKIITAKLSTMMYLQFFIWGAWYTSIAVYMSEVGMEDLTHWPFTVNPIAAIAAPFFIGLVADRFFPTQKVLGFLHIAGGIVLFITPQFDSSPLLFILALGIYNLFYMPTLGLSNSMVFHHIQNQEKDFPLIRVFGTIGWISAGLFISFVLGRFIGYEAESTPLPLYTAASASLILGLLSYFLPNTPPSASKNTVTIRSIVGIDALKMLGSRRFYVFLVSSFLISIPLAAYYNFTQLYLSSAGFTEIAGIQTLGQGSEVLFILLMPFFFVRLGVKKMLLVGMAAWVLRYALFAIGAPDQVTWMILVGIALHGICYDFFFVTGQIYVDKRSTPAIRGQAQGMLVLVTYGLGMLIGAQVAGRVYNLYLKDQAALNLEQWQSFWWLPAAMSLIVMVFFALYFREKEERSS